MDALKLSTSMKKNKNAKSSSASVRQETIDVMKNATPILVAMTEEIVALESILGNIATQLQEDRLVGTSSKTVIVTKLATPKSVSLMEGIAMGQSWNVIPTMTCIAQITMAMVIAMPVATMQHVDGTVLIANLKASTTKLFLAASTLSSP